MSYITHRQQAKQAHSGSVCACVCVCTLVCVCVCVHVCVYTCVYVCVCMSVSVYTCVNVCVCVCLCGCVWVYYDAWWVLSELMCECESGRKNKRLRNRDFCPSIN